MKLNYKNIIKYSIIGLFITICMYIIISYGTGARFSPNQVVKTNSWIEETSVLLGTVKLTPFKVYLYEGGDKYHTAIVKYRFPFWRSSGSSWANKTKDNVKLVGWCSYFDNEYGKGITVIPVQSFDDKVAYIEMGNGSDLQRKSINNDDVLIFTWEKSIQWNDLNAVAYSSDNKALYKLGYQMNTSTTEVDELRWLPCD